MPLLERRKKTIELPAVQGTSESVMNLVDSSGAGRYRRDSGLTRHSHFSDLDLDIIRILVPSIASIAEEEAMRFNVSAFREKRLTPRSAQSDTKSP